MKELELIALKESLEKQKELLAKRLCSIYKEGDLSFVQVLLRATDFSDLMTRLCYLALIADQDALLLERIEGDKAESEAKKIEIEAREVEIAESLTTLQANTKNIKDVKVLTEIKRDQIQSDLKDKKTLLTQVQRDRATAEKIEAELQRSSNELAAYIRSLESGEGPEAPIGPFKWPTTGPITSGFGMRFHPILKVYRMHTGIDIGAPYGQPILSAQSGTVIFASWQGGYGRTIIIDHGGGISTIYAHTSALNFNVGQKVNKGDIIGLVGSTGYSTGPHLHFEIREGGEPKNPMNWF
ncbi:MAG: peptidoglycan DD-metalloendopeptidase family protein [Actinomycetota bacterium]|nr:peptidoglycan DD-metalloendopeptidase family protein [Actinomycetota bacterium]